jgi:hypothetical protein
VFSPDTISGEVVGCALLPGDNASFYYAKDVMVHPAWQHKRKGCIQISVIISETKQSMNRIITLMEISKEF